MPAASTAHSAVKCRNSSATWTDASPTTTPTPPNPTTCAILIAAVQNGSAEIGLAFDGDGDRLGVVTKSGNIIYPDRQLMLFARDVLQRNPQAKIIFDVKSTRLLAPWIKEHGGEPVMEKPATASSSLP